MGSHRSSFSARDCRALARHAASAFLLRRDDLAPGGRISLYASTAAAQWLFVGLTAWRCSVRGLGAVSLGLSLPHPLVAILEGIALSLPFGFIQLAGFRAMSQIPVEKRGRVYEVARKLMPRNAVEAAAFTMLVATVSLCEEFLYRGFAYAFFLRLAHGAAIALVASSLLFGVGHLYQGPRGVILTFVLGIVFGGVRILSGSLVPGMIAHFAVDILAGFASPGALLSAAKPETGIPGSPDINL